MLGPVPVAPQRVLTHGLQTAVWGARRVGHRGDEVLLGVQVDAAAGTAPSLRCTGLPCWRRPPWRTWAECLTRLRTR